MKNLGYLTATIIVLMFNMTLSGYVLSVLWAWFISPVFDLAELTIPNAMGLTLIVSLTTKQFQEGEGEKPFSELFGDAITKAFAKCGVALLLGWLVTLFI